LPSKKSGGKRAVEKKHDERAARRRRGRWKEATWRARYAAAEAPTDPRQAHEHVAKMVLIALEEAASDPGPPPEQRRDQIARIAAIFAKVNDPAELMAELRELYDALKKGSDGAAHEPSGDAPVRAAPASLS